jgi:VWFA-related protein
VVHEKSETRRITLFKNLRPPEQLIEKRPPDQYTISNRPLAAFGTQQPVNIVVVDTRNTDPEFQPWMRSQALRFVTMLRPDADVAFYQFTASGLRLLHEFSHDKPELSRALKNVLEPETAQEFERESSSSPLRVERYRKTCVALTAAAEYLSAFKHRKNLLWMTGDFPPVFERASEECGAMLLALNRSNTAFYPVDVRSSATNEPFQSVPAGELRNVPRNRRQALSRRYLDTMVSVAALTGGRAIRNRSQLAEAMIDAVNETRFSYELGFTTRDPECDGSLHPLRVAVKMRDATVLAKQAFVADCEIRVGSSFPEPFDSPAIGVTVMPFLQSGLVHIKVLIASSDLRWSVSGASIEVMANEVKRDFQLAPSKKREPAIVELDVTHPKQAQTLRVVVRDKASERKGSVTLPLPTLEGGL